MNSILAFQMLCNVVEYTSVVHFFGFIEISTATSDTKHLVPTQFDPPKMSVPLLVNKKNYVFNEAASKDYLCINQRTKSGLFLIISDHS